MRIARCTMRSPARSCDRPFLMKRSLGSFIIISSVIYVHVTSEGASERGVIVSCICIATRTREVRKYAEMREHDWIHTCIPEMHMQVFGSVFAIRRKEKPESVTCSRPQNVVRIRLR